MIVEIKYPTYGKPFRNLNVGECFTQTQGEPDDGLWMKVGKTSCIIYNPDSMLWEEYGMDRPNHFESGSYVYPIKTTLTVGE